MAEQQKGVYDPITDRVVTIEEANRLIAERQSQPNGSLGVSNPMNPNQSVGFNLPPVPEDAAADILKAFPQVAGFLAQLLPAGKGIGMAASVGIPAMTEVVRQMLSGEETDLSQAATQGAAGGFARVGGNALRLAGKGGKSLIKRSLNLGNTPFAYNEVAETVIPKLALSERASMTTKGVETARRRAAQTGAGGLEDLAEVLAKGRYDAENAPALSGGGLMTLITRFLDNPKQLAIGKQMASPLGLMNTDTTGAQGIEGIIRSLMALISSQRGDSETTRRRPPQ